MISEDGDVVNIQLENRYIRGDIEGTKLDEDGNVIAGAVFGLFREGETEFTEETAVRITESDSTGKFRFEDIRYGKWIIRELKPATGYVLNKTPIEVEITEDGKTVFITVENKFIRGDIKGYKVDEDGKSVVGALFGLFTEDDTEFTEENAVLTAVSDADGIFIFKNVRFGKWIVRELKPAEGFVLNETEFPIDITTDGAVIEIKAENRHIYGAVHTTKVDKDYPDHLLTGAVFEVYPVVQGHDNSFYLKHLFGGEWNGAGCIFLDSRVEPDLSARHSVLYGHHMKNGTMLSDIAKYKDQTYYENHATGMILTPSKNYWIEFFAGYVAGADDENAWKVTFATEDEYVDWLNETVGRAWIKSEVIPTAEDRVITLSTCSYEFNNARFVLVGRLK